METISFIFEKKIRAILNTNRTPATISHHSDETLKLCCGLCVQMKKVPLYAKIKICAALIYAKATFL